MFIIGVTGGVGAGKSAVLDFLNTVPGSCVMLTDEIAHDLMEPGTHCYQKLQQAFEGTDIYMEDGSFDRKKLAAFIFGDIGKLKTMNGIVHPAVKEYVREACRKAKCGEMGDLQLLVIESALLIEERYQEFCDEFWYIYTSAENRRARLKATRGYSDEKVDSIFAKQLSEEQYRAECAVSIDNNGTIGDTQTQIRELLLARGIRLSI